MRKVKKVLRALIIGALIMNISVFNVYADGLDDLGKVVDGSVLTNQSTSKDVQPALTRGNYLNQGTAQITNLGGGKVNAYGATLCHVTCDRITLSITLQRYSGGYWNNVETYEYSANNSSSLARSVNVSVAKGYYYRVKGLSTAKKGSTVESHMPITDGIWIG